MISAVDLNLDGAGNKRQPDPKTKELNMGSRARSCDIIGGAGNLIAVGF